MKYEIELNEKEVNALNHMCETKGMTPEQVLKHGFRVYQTLDKKIEMGQIQSQDFTDLMRAGMPSKKNPNKD